MDKEFDNFLVQCESTKEEYEKDDKKCKNYTLNHNKKKYIKEQIQDLHIFFAEVGEMNIKVYIHYYSLVTERFCKRRNV